MAVSMPGHAADATGLWALTVGIQPSPLGHWMRGQAAGQLGLDRTRKEDEKDRGVLEQSQCCGHAVWAVTKGSALRRTLYLVSCSDTVILKSSALFGKGSWTFTLCWALQITWASLVTVKKSPASAGDVRGVGSIPGSRRWLRVGNGNPLQYSCLENSTNRGACWAAVRGVTVRHDWAASSFIFFCKLCS